MIIFIVYGVLAFALFLFFISATYIVNQSEVILLERVGRYSRTLTSGIHFIVPFIEAPRSILWTFLISDTRGNITRISRTITRIDLREAVYDFPKQNVITRDNVTMQISALLYYQVTDPKRAIYEVSDLPEAIEKLTQTTLRNVIGSLDLDETLVSRDQINGKLRLILDDATDKWGVKINRVELQEVNPPQDIRVAMEKQMRAERDRRALILEAEGQKGAAILTAQGECEAQITRAEGEARARLIIAKAEADAIAVIRDAVPGADPLPYMIALNYIKTLPEITASGAGKMVVVPYDASTITSAVAMMGELFSKN